MTPDWARVAMVDLGHQLVDRAEPYVCPFAPRLVQRGELDLAAFTPAAPDWEGLVARVTESVTAPGAGRSIAVVLGPGPLGARLVDHAADLWRMIVGLVEHDPVPWPAAASRDPDEPHFTIHIGGVPVFVLGTSPRYERRRTRRLGSLPAAVIQPLAVFATMLGDRDAARRAKQGIRATVERRDGLGPHPHLGPVDGSSTHKIWQMLLPDGPGDGSHLRAAVPGPAWWAGATTGATAVDRG